MLKLTDSPTRAIRACGWPTTLGGVFGAEVTTKPPAAVKVTVPLGVVNTTTASLAPAVSLTGMSKTAVTTCWLECVTEVPVRLPMVTLSGAAPAGGGGGTSLSSVNVTSRPVVPASAEPGTTDVISLEF